MGAGSTRLRGEQRTMLMTLSMHALDATSSHPILADGYAADLLARVDEPASASHGIRGNLPVICTRARLVDDVTRAFLDRHGEAVVVHLGCGLDSRVLRVDPGPGVLWFDLDQEPVVELRRRLYPPRDNVTTLAASVTDLQRWARIPEGRPTLVVAEGLLMYLDPAEVEALVREVLGRRAPHMVLVADTVAPWVSRISGWQPAMRAAATGFRSSTADLVAAIDAMAPTIDPTPPVSLPAEAARRTRGATSRFLRAFSASPPGRRSMVLHTYTPRSAT